MALVEDGLDGLAEFIRERRKFLGLSQAQLARELGVNQSTVHRIETGERTPGTKLFLRLLEVLRADLRDIKR
jgi:transcriptional regulator with XRE-family HTH domain